MFSPKGSISVISVFSSINGYFCNVYLLFLIIFESTDERIKAIRTKKKNTLNISRSLVDSLWIEISNNLIFFFVRYTQIVVTAFESIGEKIEEMIRTKQRRTLWIIDRVFRSQSWVGLIFLFASASILRRIEPIRILIFTKEERIEVWFVCIYTYKMICWFISRDLFLKRCRSEDSSF